MNNTQLYLAIGLPTLTSLCTLTVVVIGWFLSRADINRLNDKIDKLGDSLRAEMNDLRDSLRAEMNDLGASLRAEMATLRADINRDMVAFRKEVHGDLLMLHERVVKVETKQGL